METIEQISMIVRWLNQSRPIKINVNEDLNTIEKKICTNYQLKQNNDLRKHQIQYFDSDYQCFIDLFPDSFSNFQQLLRTLCSSEAPPKSSKEWSLQIVPKTVQTMSQTTINESITTDDTYNYQQENDPSDLHQIEESTTTSIRSPTFPDASGANNTVPLPRDPVANSTDKKDQVITQTPRSITTDHPCGLDFKDKLADSQRQQYEKDVNRNKSKPDKGGVRLRARSKANSTDNNDKSYPAVHFQIPSDQQHLEWFLHLYILTEADKDGVQYLHSSKGIYQGETVQESRCRTIRDSKSVNPCEIRLTANEIRDGKVEIFIKVCNMRDVSTRKNEILKVFSRLANPKNCDQLISSSENTMCGLKFASQKYHLGCVLICDETIHDQCVSNLTIAMPTQKRSADDAMNAQDSASKKKKK